MRTAGLVLLAGLGAAWSRAERGGVCLSGAPLTSPNVGSAAVAQTAPDVAIRISSGEKRLVDLRGKVVLIDFWATWCPPCRESIPHVADLYGTHHSRGFEVFGVALDYSDAAVASFAREQGISYFVGRPASLEAAARYGVESIPTMVLVDRRGRIRWRRTGYSEEIGKELTGQVDALLNE